MTCYQFSTNALAFAAISTDLSVNGTMSGGVCEPVCIVPASFSIQLLAKIFPSIISSSESRSGDGTRKGLPTVLTDLTMLLDSEANVNFFTNCDLLSNIITNLTKLKNIQETVGITACSSVGQLALALHGIPLDLTTDYY